LTAKPKPDGDLRAKVLSQLGEVFRAHGYEGASLSLITQATGLGKGSLYNLFPGGKVQMAKEVLAHIDDWFEQNVFAPLREDKDGEGVAHMYDAVDRYFDSGGRVCLVGVFALGSARDTFGKKVRSYFVAWEEALVAALRRGGVRPAQARDRSEEILLGIQGALVLARAKSDKAVFSRALKRLRSMSA
jgi:AcrR family transcriptional regulator